MSTFCGLEPLEKRRLLTLVVPTGSWSITGRGTLVVSGTVWDDSVSVTRKGDRILIRQDSSEFPGFAEAVSASRVKRVLIETGDGADEVHVAYDLLKHVTVQGGAGNDVIDGNAGSVLVGGGGDDRLFVPDAAEYAVFDAGSPAAADAAASMWNNAAGPAVLSGGEGNDTLVAAARDSVIGGRGNDIAFQHILLRNNENLDPVPDPLASFGDRASGIESFATAAQRWPEGGSVFAALEIVPV